MTDQSLFDKIDLHLIRVLHTVLTERSVSRAAIRLGMHQPAVSASLKRLRDFAGDPLLVRSGSTMVPTDAALRASGTQFTLMLASRITLPSLAISERMWAANSSGVDVVISAPKPAVTPAPAKAPSKAP